MSRVVFYAMDKTYLQAYIDHKNEIATAVASGRYTESDIMKIKAEISDARSDSRELYTVDADGAAHIMICGPLEPKPDPCAIMFDQDMTTYSDIINACNKAEADPAVINLVFHFETPGGNVVGLFRAADVIAGCKKKKSAIIGSLCASAGYALCSQIGLGGIYAENDAAEIGSIGVLTEVVDDSGADKGMGVKRYILTSDNAPNKAPDVATKDGRDKIVARLNELENVFINYVSKGRHTTTDNVKQSYGQGGVLIAKKALSAGMIDGIINDIESNAPIQNQNATGPDQNMQQINNGEQNATETVPTQEINAMEITQDELNKMLADAAKQGAGEALAKVQSDQAMIAAETKRKAEFAQLYNRFPNQKAMIDEESAKDGAHATADFVLKLADTETARAAAENLQKTAAGNNAQTVKSDPKEKDPAVMGEAETAKMLCINVNHLNTLGGK